MFRALVLYCHMLKPHPEIDANSALAVLLEIKAGRECVVGRMPTPHLWPNGSITVYHPSKGITVLPLEYRDGELLAAISCEIEETLGYDDFFYRFEFEHPRTLDIKEPWQE